MKDLAASPSLEVLILEDLNGVDDAALSELVRLSKLRVLYLTGTKVTDAGMKNVGKMTSLDTLCLYRTSVSDTALKELVALPGLRKLILTSQQAVREGLKATAQMKSLRIVYTMEPPGGQAEMQLIRSQLPDVQVRFRSGNTEDY
jgi:hypothetical protein